MRYSLYILVIFLLAACNNNADSKDNKPSDSTFTDAIKGNAAMKDDGEKVITQIDSTDNKPAFNNEALMSTIEGRLLKLPFVKKIASYIDSFSHHKNGMAFMFDSTENGISVMAGYNGGEHFETYYHFHIDPSTFEMQVQDEAGEMISIKEYIRRLKNNQE